MSRALPDNSDKIKRERDLDRTLRPKQWDNYIGQEKIKKNLQVIIEAAEKRGDTVEHLLFYGNPGLGKTTLAYIISAESNRPIKTITGPAIEKPGDLAAILSNLEENSILFLDEIHRIPKIVEEYLYPAMESFFLNLIVGKGPMAKTLDLHLPKFTLIGATTRLASLSGPLRSRFGAIFGLNFYKKREIIKIIERAALLLDVEINKNAINLIADCARSTPRKANHLLKRVRDFAQVDNMKKIDEKITKKALQSLEIDKQGLTESDRKILEVVIKKFQGGPVGLQALSAASGEEQDAILDIYEPYLMQLGLIERTPRGRVATQAAYKHLSFHPHSRGGLQI